MSQPTSQPRTRVPPALQLGIILGFGLLLRAAFALHDDGIYWPDEIYQSLEPGHRLAFGYGLLPWEFIDGARPWVLPAMVAAVLKLLSWLGLNTPQGYLAGLKLLFCAVGTATAYASFRLTRALGGTYPSSLFAAALFSFGSLGLYFAPRAMSETLSALPLALGLSLTLPTGMSFRRTALGLLLLAFAFWLRLQNALFCVFPLIVWAHRRDWRTVTRGSLLLGFCTLALGTLDRLTWGEWFHSARVYLQFNVIEGRASEWGTSPPAYYFRRLFSSMPSEAPALLILPWFALARAPGLFAAAAAGLVVHSLVPHKELRFILPTLPLLGALAALGGEELLLRLKRWTGTKSAAPQVAYALGLVLCLASTVAFPRLTFGELGQYGRERRNDSAFDDAGNTNRLLMHAYREAGLCGLKVETRQLAWTGGLSHLHRAARIYPPGGPGRHSGLFNFAIAPVGSPRSPGERIAAVEGNEALIQIGQDCRPDPGYSWRLP